MIRALDRWWFDPRIPPARLAALRAATGAFCVVYLHGWSVLIHESPYLPESRFAPIGVTTLLADPGPAWVIHVLWALALPLAVAFAAGWRYRVLAPIFAGVLLWLTTYRNSFGMVFHTENLMVLHVIVLALAPAADVHSLDARRAPRPVTADGRHGWAVRLMCAITVGAYVLAGVAKVRNSGWDWGDGDVIRAHVAFDNLRKIGLGDSHAVLGGWLVGFAWVFPPLAWLTLAFEFLAPLALLGRRIGKVWCVIAWGFHLGVALTMWILFLYPLCGCAFLSFFEAERLWSWRRWRRGGASDDLGDEHAAA